MKRVEALTRDVTWMDLENKLLNGRSQDGSLPSHVQYVQSHRDR